YLIPISVPVPAPAPAPAPAPVSSTAVTATPPAAVPQPQPTRAGSAAAAPTVERETGEYWYTVKEGDSLWRIAKEQLGRPGAVAAIKELNKDVLGGDNHDVVTVGMKIRLPGKPIAQAN